MNTKTMRLPPRRVSMPNNSINIKRKEREVFDLNHFNSLPPPTKLPKPAALSAGSEKAAHLVMSNQLLAGYLACEFLTRETLLGQPWHPARPQQTAAESRRGIREYAEPSERSRAGNVEKEQEPEPEPEPKPREEKQQRYMEVASLLKTNGAHIPGIVNPSQLAGFLHL